MVFLGQYTTAATTPKMTPDFYCVPVTVQGIIKRNITPGYTSGNSITEYEQI